MLVLTRKIGEKVCISTDIVVTVLAVQGSKVRIGIEAPTHVPIVRGEISRPLVISPGSQAERYEECLHADGNP